MAAPMDFKKVLHDTINSAVSEIGIHVKKLSVVQRSNDFKLGDFYVPSGCMNVEKDQALSKLRDNIRARLISENFPVEKVSGDQHSIITVYLIRPWINQALIKRVISEKCSYSITPMPDEEKDEEKVIIYNTQLNNIVTNGETDDVSRSEASLNILRSSVLQQHTTNIFTSNGFSVVCPTRGFIPRQYLELLNEVGIDVDNFVNYGFDIPDKKIKDEAIANFAHSPYVTKTDHIPADYASGDSSVECDMKSELVTLDFNLRQHIQDKCLKSGKTDYDKNLSTCNVCTRGEASDIFSEAIWLYKVLQRTNATQCVHLVNQSQTYNQQKVMLLINEMFHHSSQTIKQRIFVAGSVVVKNSGADGSVASADDYLRMKYAELRQAAVMKYGEAVHGEGWAGNLRTLTAACVKLEMLSTVPRTVLKIDASDDTDEGGVSGSNSSFVMYNCARLAKLFSHFQDAVDDGIYPPLPDIDEVDFHTLREEQEWSLLFNYVYLYPVLVREGLLQDFHHSDSIVTNIHTHKICQMLYNLARCLSSYYSRYHVLGEARSHLLPLMYARLCLLKAVYQVMENALCLIGVHPLKQL